MSAIRFSAVPPDGECEHMTVEDFIANVKAGMFIDYDGHGYWSTEKEESDQRVIPSDLSSVIPPAWATHVTWYNR